ncbi:hypothetical protein [Nocardia sp. NPDC048505]|uniref:hypothetical protein n=1 Tax=unclassified Nocardia TaxID=2637762 RepID=UPI0033C60688
MVLFIGTLVFTILVVVTLRWRGKSWLVVVLGGVVAALVGYVVGLEAMILWRR